MRFVNALAGDSFGSVVFACVDVYEAQREAQTRERRVVPTVADDTSGRDCRLSLDVRSAIGG